MNLLRGVSSEACAELKELLNSVPLTSDDEITRDVLSKFYIHGYKQAQIEHAQSIIRKLNNARKQANERHR